MLNYCKPVGGKFKDLSGRVCGHLTVLEWAYSKTYSDNSRVHFWMCRCECGETTVVSRTNLLTKSGKGIKSCGCKLREWQHSTARRIHNKEPRPVYGTWAAMINRCQNESGPDWKDYGGRGISVCQEWRQSFIAFRDWSLANGWVPGLEIDRIDVNGNYDPGNCRWTNDTVQARNKRSNLLITIGEETRCLAEWAEIVGIQSRSIQNRISRGWNPVAAVQTPLKTQRENPGCRNVTIDGETLCVAEWAKRSGIPAPTILMRLNRGWAAERAVSEPINVSKRNRFYRGT